MSFGDRARYQLKRSTFSRPTTDNGWNKGPYGRLVRFHSVASVFAWIPRGCLSDGVRLEHEKKKKEKKRIAAGTTEFPELLSKCSVVTKILHRAAKRGIETLTMSQSR
jgi:hypothetical protein